MISYGLNISTEKKLLECVPNFSEGRDVGIIEKIANAIKQVPNVALLHVDASPAANRTVYTFIGAPSAVLEACFQAANAAVNLIDMRTQEGVHPRIGAMDVCPLIPIANVSMEELMLPTQQLAKRMGTELQLPVFLYEHSQPIKFRKPLPAIRSGQYEGLAEKIKQEDWLPDEGPAVLHPSAGAVALGLRDVLVAFNISINTTDESIAQRIAQRMRSAGYVQTKNGATKKVKGLLRKTRAIGWFMADYGVAQVSFNLLDFRVTSLLSVWLLCRDLCKEYGCIITGAEIIGLVPERCILEAGEFALLETGQQALDKEEIMQAGIQFLMLDQLKPFHPKEKILEWAIVASPLL